MTLPEIDWDDGEPTAQAFHWYNLSAPQGPFGMGSAGSQEALWHFLALQSRGVLNVDMIKRAPLIQVWRWERDAKQRFGLALRDVIERFNKSIAPDENTAEAQRIANELGDRFSLRPGSVHVSRDPDGGHSVSIDDHIDLPAAFRDVFREKGWLKEGGGG